MGTVSLIANIEALIIRIGFGGCVYTYIYIYTIRIRKNPQNPILILKAPYITPDLLFGVLDRNTQYKAGRLHFVSVHLDSS